mgnify:FL=1
MECFEYLIAVVQRCIQGRSLLISTLLFWSIFAAGICLKSSLDDGKDNVYYGKSQDIRELRYWCWINYFIGVILLLIYLYKLNRG